MSNSIETTDRGAGILARIRGLLPSLPPSERRVGNEVLNDPSGAPLATSDELARRAGVSLATITRFCRSLGLSSYQQLRFELAGDAARGRTQAWTAAQGSEIKATDTLAEIAAGLLSAEIQALENTLATVDLAVLERIVDAIVAAPRIDIYGVSGSGAIAEDLGRRLHLIRRPAYTWTDPHDALASAALLGADDVAIGFSHSGHTQDVIQSISRARQSGATTVAITNFPRSPLVAAADLSLITSAAETTFRSGGLSGRQVQLFVVDLLYVGVAQRTYETSMSAIATTAAAVESRRAPRLSGRKD